MQGAWQFLCKQSSLLPGNVGSANQVVCAPPPSSPDGASWSLCPCLARSLLGPQPGMPPILSCDGYRMNERMRKEWTWHPPTPHSRPQGLRVRFASLLFILLRGASSPGRRTHCNLDAGRKLTSFQGAGTAVAVGGGQGVMGSGSYRCLQKVL